MVKIVLDTSFLLTALNQNVDWGSEIHAHYPQSSLCIPMQVDDELNWLPQKKKLFKKKVILIRRILEKNSVKKIMVEAPTADEALIALARKGYWVATNDQEVKEQVKKLNGKIIFLRQKKLIQME